MKEDNIKNIFLTANVHQLRTSLSGARWAIESVIKNSDCVNKDLLTEALNKIVYSIEMIGEILKFSEEDFNEDKIKLYKNKFYLNDLIKKIISNLSFLAQEKEISLDYEEKGLFEINADEKMIGIVLTNIFDNAFRYSPKSKVFISIEKKDSFVKIIVKDNGIGIDPQEMEHISQKFFRGKNAIDFDPKESGVGLYATKKIIEMHGGNIKISSVLNKGTTVEVSLPLIH
ncbi:MAG: HAMP domain-containing sensor histidine kinase [Candidatus Taylorbacteria bacterium]|nr:HAMP domain-containing sensor histidine kinase [Candidatus Taylorbacteria bacterium]